MAGDLLTTLTNFHQTHYRDAANSDVPDASPVAKRIFTKSRRISLGGTSVNTTWEHETASGVGFGSLETEGSDFPAPGYDSAINPTLAATFFGASVGWSRHALKAGTKTRFDKKKLIKKKSMALTDSLKKHIARYFMHDGTEILGTTAAASGTTNGYITLASGSCPIHFFEPGDEIGVYDATDSGTNQLTNAATGGGRIVGIDPDLGRIYLADATGLTGGGGEYIAWLNTYDTTCPNGIRNLIDSGATVQGITRTAAAGAVWRCIEIDHGSASLTADLVDQLRDRVMDQARLRTGESYQSEWVGNRKMRRWMSQLSAPLNRFTDLDDLSVGVRQVAINDKNGRKKMVEDEYIIDGELYCAVWEKFVLGTPEGTDDNGVEPIMNGNSAIFQLNAASGQGHADASRQYAAWTGNIGLDEARCQGKAVSIAAPA